MTNGHQPTRFRDLPPHERILGAVVLVAILAPLAVYLYMRDQHRDALACEQPVAELYLMAYDWENGWRRFQDHNTSDEDRRESWQDVRAAYNRASFAWYDIEQACTGGRSTRRSAPYLWEQIQDQLEPRREICTAILRQLCDKPRTAP